MTELPCAWQKVNEQGRCRCGCPLSNGRHRSSGDLLMCAGRGWKAADTALSRASAAEAQRDRALEVAGVAKRAVDSLVCALSEHDEDGCMDCVIDANPETKAFLASYDALVREIGERK